MSTGNWLGTETRLLQLQNAPAKLVIPDHPVTEVKKAFPCHVDESPVPNCENPPVIVIVTFLVLV
jgi:hypothetical protein